LRCGNIKATIWQNVSGKSSFLATTFSCPFEDQSGAWHNGTSLGLNDLEALLNVACEAKEWITAHTLKRFRGKSSAPPGNSFTATRCCESQDIGERSNGAKVRRHCGAFRRFISSA